MYVLFAVLVSLIVYGLASISIRLCRSAPPSHGRLALGSLLVLILALAVFNFGSRAAGVDLGPFHAVSYNIPDDYLARGTLGLLALIPYAVACLSPAISFAVFGARRSA